MSYIRSTSNPEALYIYGGINNVLDISFGKKDSLLMPTSVFDGLIKKFNRDTDSYKFDIYSDDVLKYRGATISWVKHGRNFKVRLSYDGKVGKIDVKWECFMWLTTWMYIANENREDIVPPVKNDPNIVQCDKCKVKTDISLAIDAWCNVNGESYCLTCQRKYKVGLHSEKK